MEQKAIDRLIKCREIVDYFLIYYPHVDESYNQCVTYIEDELKKEGFDSFKEFIAFNEQSNNDEWKRCYPISGYCDWCGEDKLETQQCVVRFGLTSCTQRVKGEVANDAIYWDAKQSGKNNTLRVVENTLRGGCPDGHGFYMLLEDKKDPLFNPYWEALSNKPANSNWTKQEFDKSSINKPILKEVD